MRVKLGKSNMYKSLLPRTGSKFVLIWINLQPQEPKRSCALIPSHEKCIPKTLSNQLIRTVRPMYNAQFALALLPH